MKSPERIALKKEHFDLILKELKIIGILFLTALAIFKIAFFNESILVVLRAVFSVFWLFLIPGYFIMLYWNEKLDLTERIIVGMLLSAAILGIFSYYLGLIGLDIKYSTIILPIVLILCGGYFGIWKKSKLSSIWFA